LINFFKTVLKNKNLKYTLQREVILKILYNNDQHFTPEELYIKIKKEYPNLNIGIATIYRTLNLLEESDIITSISFGQSGKKYEIAIRHHDHLICDLCGKIIEFEDEEIEKRQEEIAAKYDFLIKSHILQLHGICKECRKKNKKEK
ncbi:MAG: transcriptional repressor, partial [Epsilonproteobacteria bacterium]|nr:transcriptional repressor [Campylobacterota bacterium]